MGILPERMCLPMALITLLTIASSYLVAYFPKLSPNALKPLGIIPAIFAYQRINVILEDQSCSKIIKLYIALRFKVQHSHMAARNRKFSLINSNIYSQDP
jgi:hypothetical protein